MIETPSAQMTENMLPDRFGGNTYLDRESGVTDTFSAFDVQLLTYEEILVLNQESGMFSNDTSTEPLTDEIGFPLSQNVFVYKPQVTNYTQSFEIYQSFAPQLENAFLEIRGAIAGIPCCAHEGSTSTNSEFTISLNGKSSLNKDSSFLDTDESDHEHCSLCGAEKGECSCE